MCSCILCLTAVVVAVDSVIIIVPSSVIMFEENIGNSRCTYHKRYIAAQELEDSAVSSSLVVFQSLFHEMRKKVGLASSEFQLPPVLIARVVDNSYKPLRRSKQILRGYSNNVRLWALVLAQINHFSTQWSFECTASASALVLKLDKTLMWSLICVARKVAMLPPWVLNPDSQIGLLLLFLTYLVITCSSFRWQINRW